MVWRTILIILSKKHIALPATTNHDADPTITTFVWISNRYFMLKDLFLKSPETFRAFYGYHNSLYMF